MPPPARSGSSQPGLLIQFRPMGPWRPGPESGAADRVDRIYHSDTLFSAVSSAMQSLGALEDWLDATARVDSVPEVCFSSCFPYQGQTLFVTPPRSLWPPPPSAKVRWKGARFVPAALIERLLAEKPLEEDRWRVDGLSQCLLPAGKNHPASGPLRVALRSHAAVDRLGTATLVHSTACLEFSADAGLWTTVLFSGEEARSRWAGRLTAALRLLADSGFGGKRSRGWGRAESPRITEGLLPDLLLKTASPAGDASTETAYWLLSLFSPAEDDRIDWQRGNYSVVMRSGRAESPAGWGAAKKTTRMVEEGSVLLAPQPPAGSAPDVAPDGFPHPVFRAGFAVAIPIPWRAVSRTVIPKPAAGETPAAPLPLAEPVEEIAAAAEAISQETAAPAEPSEGELPTGENAAEPVAPVESSGSEAEAPRVEPVASAEPSEAELSAGESTSEPVTPVESSGSEAEVPREEAAASAELSEAESSAGESASEPVGPVESSGSEAKVPRVESDALTEPSERELPTGESAAETVAPVESSESEAEAPREEPGAPAEPSEAELSATKTQPEAKSTEQAAPVEPPAPEPTKPSSAHETESPRPPDDAGKEDVK